MPTPTTNLIASDVMDATASLLNDTAKSVYNYTVQLPYLRIAIMKLRELLEYNNVPVTDKVSPVVVTVPAGVTVIGFDTNPSLPLDLISIEQLWETLSGQQQFVPMTKLDFLPHYLEGSNFNSFVYWSWNGNAIQVLPAVQNNDLKIDYIAELFSTDLITQNTIIRVINSRSYLQFKTASLIAKFIMFNDDLASLFEAEATDSSDMLLGIEAKARQSIYTRHRPFRAGWKSRGLW